MFENDDWFHNPQSSLFNTDVQIFSESGAPCILMMENYDINRTGYHDTFDTLQNIDLDYGAALSAICIETVARVATGCAASSGLPLPATSRNTSSDAQGSA